MSRTYFVLTIASACLTVMLATDAQAREPEAANQVVILIDGSGSFRLLQGKAIERSVALLDTIAKTELRRWESSRDRIVVISIDAMPEVLWQGDLTELKAQDRASWTARFRARTDYAQCTDVGAAFSLATKYLDGDPRYVSRYIFAFSDLIDEPPTTSLWQCRPPKDEPPEEFPWEELQGVRVSVFWVRPNAKFVWRRQIEAHGLGETFALYTTGESDAVVVQPPPRAELPPEVLAERRSEDVQRAKEFIGGVATWAGVIVGSVFAVVIATLITTARRRRLSAVQPRDRAMAATRGASAPNSRPPGSSLPHSS